LSACHSSTFIKSNTFFFQAEDGIRDFHVTGVQTCALPIYHPKLPRGRRVSVPQVASLEEILFGPAPVADGTANLIGALRKSMARSEERRVGKESSSRSSPCDEC